MLEYYHPTCIFLFLKQNFAGIEYGRTEKIDNNIDPNFIKSITIQYHF